MTGPHPKAFVTGADGFIGSHLVEALLAQGREVRALALYDPRGGRGWLDEVQRDGPREGLEIVQGDLRDGPQVKRLMAGCEVVFNLAALIGIPYSYEAPASYIETNVVGTLNVLEAARELGGVKVIQTSTSEVYGSAQRVPIDEDHPLQAQSPYAASKIAADQLALSYHRSFGLPVVVVRPFNTYGPRQSRRAIIPTVIAQLASGATRLTLGNLHPTRDLLYVADTARGFVMAEGSVAALGETLNFGTGREISIGDLARKISALMGVEAEILQDEARLRPADSEVERLCAGIEKAGRLLGWRPEDGGLEAGLRRTIEWFIGQPAANPHRALEYTR